MKITPAARPILLALAVTVPLAAGATVLGVGLMVHREPDEAMAAETAQPVASPTPTTSPSKALAATSTPTPTPPPVVTPEPEAVAAPPAPVVNPEPQGEVVLDEWHDLAGDLTCALVQTFYDNRSDTAILSVKQTFVTMYTPKHAEGEYPELADGPTVSLTQTVGIAPYTRKENSLECVRSIPRRTSEPPETRWDRQFHV